MTKFQLGNIFGDWARDRNCSVLQPWLGRNVWELIPDLGTLVSQLRAARGNTKPKRISPTAILRGEIFLGDDVYVGDYSLIRGPAVLLDGSVVGHASEVIQSFVGPKSRVSHKVTMGHSIVGRNANLGASVSIASVLMANEDMECLTKGIHILLETDGQKSIDTGLLKFGAGIGDDVRIGMNSSLGPGVIVHPRTLVSPNIFLQSSVYGPDAKILNLGYKSAATQQSRYRQMDKYATLVEQIFAAYRTLRDDQILDRTGGAVSQRAPDGNIVISATGSAGRGWGTARENVTVITSRGELALDNYPLAVSGTPVHLAIYESCPGAMAVVHGHAPYSLAFASRGADAPNSINLLDALGDVPCLLANDQAIKDSVLKSTDRPVVPTGIVQRPDVYAINMHLVAQLRDRFSQRFSMVPRRPLAFLIQRHGLFSFGRDLDTAIDAARRVESSCRTALLARLIQEPPSSEIQAR